jgi:hypothetical protein
VNLVTGGLDHAAGQCGITDTLIRDAVTFPVSSSNLRIADPADPSSPDLRISLNVMYFERGQQCFSSVRMEVLNYQKVQLDFTNGPPVWANVLLWQSDWTVAGPVSRHPQQLRTIIENQTKGFLTEWNLANRP